MKMLIDQISKCEVIARIIRSARAFVIFSFAVIFFCTTMRHDIYAQLALEAIANVSDSEGDVKASGDEANINAPTLKRSKKQPAPPVLTTPKAEIKPFETGTELRVDNWVDIWMCAQLGAAGKPLTGTYKVRHDLLDAGDSRNSLFSVKYTLKKPAGEMAFGFYPGQYISHWKLEHDFVLSFWIKTNAGTSIDKWKVVLFDLNGKSIQSPLKVKKVDGVWSQVEILLSEMIGADAFKYEVVSSVQVEAILQKEESIWLDDVYFYNASKNLGISDKTITQYMAENLATRARRVEEDFATDNASPNSMFFADLYNGENLSQTNKEIVEWINEMNGVNGSWSLFLHRSLQTLLRCFSSKGLVKPGRITPETEKIILAKWWDLLKLKNDIATARQSTWWVTGSENHDINLKMATLLSSQIFMHEANFSKMIYPDLGRMQGYGYGDGSTFTAGKKSHVSKLGSGNYKDGKFYTAADHYKEWVVFWKSYVSERAKHGFFIEHNAATYMSHTNGFLHQIYAWVEDPELKMQMRMFIDLVWAQWCQDQCLGITSGPVTRGVFGYTRLGKMAEFLLGGPGLGSPYTLSDYEWPREVWEIALGRKSMGEYACLARKPHESQDVSPQPPGTEYTILVRPDSRIVRYTWVTPDYVLGSRFDYPNALYHHLSASRDGIIFATTPNALIQWGDNDRRISVQDRNVCLFRQKPSFAAQNPMWFPPLPALRTPIQVNFSNDLNRKLVERDGWIFVEEGNAYVALRVVAPSPDSFVESNHRMMPAAFAVDENGFGLLKPDPMGYTWLEGDTKKKGSISGRGMVAKDINAGMIVECSRQAVHENFDKFQADVLDNPIKLKQFIQGGYYITYKGCGADAKELQISCGGNDVPTIDGKPISYLSPTFQSPWINAEAGSGVVTITGPLSQKKLTLDFNAVTRR